jgi:hypothetical protein
MGASTVALRLLAVAAGALAIWYIVDLNDKVTDLEAQVAAASKPAASQQAAAGAARVADAAAAEPRTISIGQRAAMVETLSGGGTHAGSPVWFATVPNNPEATAFQQALQSIFEDAGWQVKGNSVVGFSMKPGVYVFAADTEPPDYVKSITESFDAAGIALASTGYGYRDYYKERKAESPTWTGFDMAADQTVVVAIGRQAEAPTPVQ